MKTILIAFCLTLQAAEKIDAPIEKKIPAEVMLPFYKRVAENNGVILQFQESLTVQQRQMQIRSQELAGLIEQAKADIQKKVCGEDLLDFKQDGEPYCKPKEKK